MKFAVFIFSMLFSFSFINTAAQENQTARVSTDQATVYFYSLKTIKTLGQVKKPVFLDDQEIAEVRPERYFVVKLAPGKHNFRLRDKKFGGIEMEFKAGETYYLRMNWQADGTLKPAGISLIPNESGAYDIKQLKPVDEKNIKNKIIVSLN